MRCSFERVKLSVPAECEKHTHSSHRPPFHFPSTNQPNMSFPLARSTFTAASTCRRLLSSSAVRSAPPPSDASSSSARGQGPMSNALAAVAEGEIQRQAVSGRVLGFGAPANRQRGGFGAIQSAAGHAPNLRPANIGPFVKGQVSGLERRCDG